MSNSRPGSDASPLSAPGEGPSIVRDYGRGRGGSYETMSRQPRHERDISSSSVASDKLQSPSSTTSSEATRRTIPLNAKGKASSRTPAALVLVTLDGDQLQSVDVSTLTSSTELRERMLSRVHVADDEMAHCTIHWGQIGALEDASPALDDAELLDMCSHASELPNFHAFVVKNSGPLAYASPSVPSLEHNRIRDGNGEGSHARNDSRSTVSEEVADYMLHDHPNDTDDEEPLAPASAIGPKSRWAKSRISDPAPSTGRLRSDSDPHAPGRSGNGPRHSADWPHSAGVAEGDERQRRDAYFENEAYAAEQRQRHADEQRRREWEAQHQPQRAAQPRSQSSMGRIGPQPSPVPTPPIPSSARMQPNLSGPPRGPPSPYLSSTPAYPDPRTSPVQHRHPASATLGPPRNALPARSMDDMRAHYSHSVPPPGSQPMYASGSQSRTPRPIDPRGPRPDPRYQPQVDPRLYDSARHALGPRQMGGPRLPPQQAMPQGPYIRPPPSHPPVDPRRQGPPPLNVLPAPPTAPQYTQGSVVYTQRPPPGSRMIATSRLPQAMASPASARPPQELLAGRYQQRPPQQQPMRAPSPQPPYFDARQRLPLQPGEVLQDALAPRSMARPPASPVRDDRRQAEYTPRPDDPRYARRPSTADDGDPRQYARRPSHTEEVPRLPPRPRDRAEGVEVSRREKIEPIDASLPPAGRHTPSSSGGSASSHPDRPNVRIGTHPTALTPGRATPKRSDEASSPRRSSDREDEGSTRTYSSSGRPSSRSSATSLESPVVGPPPPACFAAPSAPELWEDDLGDDPEGATYRPGAKGVAAIPAEEGMARAGDWQLRLNFEGNSGSLGLLDEGTLRPNKAQPAAKQADTDFGDFDDDIEASTWQMAPSNRSNEPPKTDRPALRLQISEAGKAPLPAPPVAGPSSRTPPSAAVRSTSPPPARTGAMRKQSSNTAVKTKGAPLTRKMTMQTDVRPSADQLYENLDDYFPNHDLDRPILEASSADSPTARPEHLVGQAARSSAGQTAGASVVRGVALGRTKSIRTVAESRRSEIGSSKNPLRALTSIANTVEHTFQNLSRRKSTKLWGKTMEEVTPGQESFLAAPIKVPPISEVVGDEEDSENFSFKWVKGELIGKGSYGKVYIGLNVTTGDVLAVKQVELPKTNSDREDDRQAGSISALKYEIETLKDLDHPHIVAYLGFEQTTEHLSIFIEYVPGGSVGRWVRKFGKFEESVVASFAVQILDGLEYLHARGILHRDLKADNCLVDLNGVIKISDFGISKRSNNVYEANEGMSMQGSIFWMAPEVVHNAKKGYSAKVDIWSLGCVVLEMFAGRRPWDAEFAIAAMFKLGAERLAPPVPEDVTLSPNAEAFLSRCFIIDPEKRPTASDLQRDPLMTISPSWSFSQTLLSKAIRTASAATPPASAQVQLSLPPSTTTPPAA